MVGSYTRVELLPGDVFTQVNKNPPRLVVRLLGVDGESASITERLEALIKSTRVLDAEGKEVDFVAKKLVAPGYDVPGIEVRPKQVIKSGWHRLEVDVSAVGSAHPAAIDPMVAGKVTARFNIKSQPTLRRLMVCASVGEVRVQFSEPMKAGATAKPMEIWDESGKAVCDKGIEYRTLAADGESLGLRCDGELPNVLHVTMDEKGFVSKSGSNPLLALDGSPIDLQLHLEVLPNPELGDTDCRMYVP